MSQQRSATPLFQPLCTGFVDTFETGLLKGWAFDQRQPDQPAVLSVLIDGDDVGTITCDQPRDDVAASMGYSTGLVGFTHPIPAAYLDGETHEIAVQFDNGVTVPFLNPADPEASLPSLEFSARAVATIRGQVDGMGGGVLRGWALRTLPGTTAMLGGCTVVVTCDGVPVTQLRCDRYRTDVASALGCDPNCGFELILPPVFRKATPQSFRFVVMPEEVELGGSPLLTSTVTDQLEGRLLAIVAAMDKLHVEFTRLRREVQGIIPQPGFTIADYDRWARRYYDDLRARTASARQARSAAGDTAPRPLVSVLCPVYRPVMSDFVAAVDSVVAQTYDNWELVIVDDASRQPELTERINAYCRADSRIRTVKRGRQGGISNATNTLVAAARGELVAFFDHDDLLVDVALETMVEARLRTGARLLYSDEDKIDQAGYFLEPNLKPDYNYRYLLGCNYICHLLMVERAVLADAGPLDAKYDGAQDHDLILRIVEHLRPGEVHHVPEVLYHWRKTPNSTAADISKKGYAVDAGVRAVSDHLARTGHKASVSPIRGLTLYGVEWLDLPQPRVTIIIPYKDQVATTRHCLDCILSSTDYPGFDVVLVDNWSLTAEAAAFAADLEGEPGIRVLRVEEGFNYSRLNNLAVATTDAELLFFMNNDLFVTDPSWLRRAVAEMMAFPEVAIVGGKFAYPNHTLQHAGVVVGSGGVAVHVHRGLPDQEYGYIGRAMLSHEVSAVTAAGMLVRASVFRELGGFDEEKLTVAFNDVDLCLKARDAGHKVVFCAEFAAEHHESLSRGGDDTPRNEARFFAEHQVMFDRWGDKPFFRNDPFYSPHFTVDGQPFFDLVDPGARPQAEPPPRATSVVKEVASAALEAPPAGRRTNGARRSADRAA